MNKADSSKLGYIGRKPGDSRDSNSWYTPTMYLDAARTVLGDIGLDPFSSELANRDVRARRILTEENDSFATEWKTPSHCRTVWMNPPYGRGVINAAAERFLHQYHAGAFDRAIVLVNNATETKWFQNLMKEATMICWTDHRIAFASPDGKHVSGNTRGQCFLYFDSDSGRGSRPGKFKRTFNRFGLVTRGVA